jgi:hypothetical protein
VTEGSRYNRKGGVMKKLSLLLLVVSLMVPQLAAAKGEVEDPGSPNFLGASAAYDRREIGPNIPGALFNRYSGSYFLLVAQIVVGSSLNSYDDVLSVKAIHSSGKEYQLRIVQGCHQWCGVPQNQYVEFLRPWGWMYTGVWRFELRYIDRSGKVHFQYINYPMVNPFALPHAVRSPEFYRDQQGRLIASWGAIGNLYAGGNPRFDYRLLLYDLNEDPACAFEEVRGNWNSGPGWFDSRWNRVYFPIPAEYEGKPVRMETRIFSCDSSNPAICNWHRGSHLAVAYVPPPPQ